MFIIELKFEIILEWLEIMKFGKKKFLVLRENIIEGYEVFCFIVLLEGLSFFEVNIDGDVKFEVRVSGKFFF